MKFCFEQKRYPSGHQNHFQARPLIVRPGFALLFFVSKRAYQLQHIYLPIKTVTFGFYWSDQLFNLYVFIDPDKSNLRAFYFNVCDKVMISADRVSWRDLWVDVLALPCRDPIILDQAEIPDTCSRNLKDKIYKSVDFILGDLNRILFFAQSYLSVYLN